MRITYAQFARAEWPEDMTVGDKVVCRSLRRPGMDKLVGAFARWGREVVQDYLVTEMYATSAQVWREDHGTTLSFQGIRFSLVEIFQTVNWDDIDALMNDMVQHLERRIGAEAWKEAISALKIITKAEGTYKTVVEKLGMSSEITPGEVYRKMMAMTSKDIEIARVEAAHSLN
jgi:hypothetical protein